VVVVEREGPFITVNQAREIQRLALRTPHERRGKVLVLTDFHLVREAAPALLKVVEEPPAGTVFVILAEQVPRELETLASRCVRVDCPALRTEEIAAVLASDGLAADTAAEVAEAAGGRLDRARLLASDPGFVARRQVWRDVPRRLDGTGAAVAVVAAELVELLGSAAVGPLAARHRAERQALEERVERTGERGAGRRELGERHRRELRRLRTDELRFGLLTIQTAYRDALVSGEADARSCVDAVEAVHAATEALEHNPNEALLLQSLLLRLPPLGAPSGARVGAR
jgi:DNA polymerase-3 subunit delta'